MKDKHHWIISVDGCGAQVEVVARQYGAACRKAFRVLIRSGRLKKQPRTLEDGTFANTHAEVALNSDTISGKL